MALSMNVLTNIKNNYCSMYNCWEIEEDLFSIIKEKNGASFYIYMKLVEYFGRILEHDSVCFKGELGRNTHYHLLKELENKMLFKLTDNKKYERNDDIWVTFLIFR